jgi:CDP-diacylglycerol---serine O-phosphatidyltransferase
MYQPEQLNFESGGRAAEGPAAAGKKPRGFRRGVYLLPSALTVGNLLCGYYAILSTLKGSVVDLDHAARAIGIAFLFDMLDGRVARATGTNSEFGKELDSLADIVSFGIAPAFMAFAWGVRGMLVSEARPAHLIYQMGWVVTFVFVICCAWRLARFNIHGMAPGSSRYFVGLPTPAAAGAIAATIHAMWSPIQDWRLAALWLVIVLTLAVLMVSTVRYLSFKNLRWTGRRVHSISVVLMALLLASVIWFSEETLLLIAAVYVLQGVTMHLVRFLRRKSPAEAASRPAHT